MRDVPDRVLVVVDEAYFEYVDASDFIEATELRGLRERLAILRTFSKAYGLAALRVGYAVASPDVVEHLNRLRAPFNVGTPGQHAARVALGDQETPSQNGRRDGPRPDGAHRVARGRRGFASLRARRTSCW